MTYYPLMYPLGTMMNASNVLLIHAVVVEIFHSGPKAASRVINQNDRSWIHNTSVAKRKAMNKSTIHSTVL